MFGECDYSEFDWTCCKRAGHDGPHESRPMVPDLMAALEASLSAVKRPAPDGGTESGAGRTVPEPATGEATPRRYRMIVVYEVEGEDDDDADRKFDKLNAAAKRLGIGRGFVDAAGNVRDDEGMPAVRR